MKTRLSSMRDPVLLSDAQLSLTGCASSLTSGNTVRRSETGRTHTLERGEMIYVRKVTIEGEAGGAGAVAGGPMGLALGSLDGGSGRGVARTGGTVAGAAAGNAIERNITTRAGVKVAIRLESGEVVVVIRAADEIFEAGTRSESSAAAMAVFGWRSEVPSPPEQGRAAPAFVADRIRQTTQSQ